MFHKRHPLLPKQTPKPEACCWCFRSIERGYYEPLAVLLWMLVCFFLLKPQLSNESSEVSKNQSGPWQSLFVQPVFDVFHSLPLWEPCVTRVMETMPKENQLCSRHYVVLLVKDQIMEPCTVATCCSPSLSCHGHHLCWKITVGQSRGQTTRVAQEPLILKASNVESMDDRQTHHTSTWCCTTVQHINNNILWINVLCESFSD